MIDLLAWSTAGAALAVALLAWFPWGRANLSHDMFVAMVHKLLAAGNPDRARKLCKAAPNAPFVAACDAALAALEASKGEPDAEVSIRMREAFDRALLDGLHRAGKTSWLALVAAALAGVAGYLVLIEHATPWALSLAGVALFVIFLARHTAMKIAIAAGTHRDPLLTAMTAVPRTN